MFDDNDIIDEEEMAPEEESFPVDEEQSNQEAVQETLDDVGGEILEKVGVPEPIAKAAVKTNGGPLSPGNLPGNKFLKNKATGALSKSPVGDALNKNKNRGPMPNGQRSSGKGQNEQEDGEQKNEEQPEKGKGLADQAADKGVDLALEKLEKMGPKGKIAAEVIKKTGAKEKISDLVDKAIKKMKRDKMKLILKLISPLLPYIFSALAILLLISVVMSQIMLVMESVDKALTVASTGVEKIVNFLSGEGWNTEEQQFFKTLDEQYTESLRYSQEGIDIPLIAATIHYSRLTDVSVYEQDVGGEVDPEIDPESDTDSLFSNFVSGEEMKNFYYVANDKLGSLTDFTPGNRKLIGHMVDISVEWGSFGFSDALSKWGDFFAFFGNVANDTVLDTVLSLFNPLQWYQKVRTIFVYDDSEEQNAEGYFRYKWRNIKYETEELFSLFGSMKDEMSTPTDVSYAEDGSVDTSSNTGFWPAPNVIITIDEEKYYEYLMNVYIPGTFFSDNDTVTEDEKERMAREIFKQRDEYKYLIGEESDSSLYAGNNVEVSITSCDKNTILESVSLFDYVEGALYIETGLDKPDEYLKAQAIAIKSQLFAKNNVLPDSIPASLRIANCEMYQRYCNVTSGCHSLDDGTVTGELDANDTIVSGPDASGNYLYGAIEDQTTKDKLKNIIESTLNEFVVNNDRFVLTQSRSTCTDIVCDKTTNIMDKTSAIELAKSGATYTQILGTYYTGELKEISIAGGYPLDKQYTTISSRFGWRNHPIQKCCKLHTGYDFDVPASEPIYSVDAGVVIVSQTSFAKTGYGNYVEIGHGKESNGVYEYYSLYAHMIETPLVGAGETVKAGQIIGKVGSTGASTGAHLHFEVFNRRDGQKILIDPIKFLSISDLTYKASSHFDTEAQCLAAGVPSC